LFRGSHSLRTWLFAVHFQQSAGHSPHRAAVGYESGARAWTVTTSPAATWTGIYLGLNGGFTFGYSSWNGGVTGSSTGNFGTSGSFFWRDGERKLRSRLACVRRRGRWRLGRRQRLRHVYCVRSPWRRLPDDKHLARHRARPRRLCLRPIPRLRHRRRRLQQLRGELLKRSRYRLNRGRLDRRRRRRGRLGAKFERQGRISFVKLADGSRTTDCAIANANGPPVMPTAAVKFSESVVRGGINYSLAWKSTGRSRRPHVKTTRVPSRLE
jgi:hypothetical protein